ncbi:MAG: hypothetical protein KGV50_05305 [Gammaproteobacteria bacterium]|nr:hypothetical protein [Gammaproteobacteria bacterium]
MKKIVCTALLCVLFYSSADDDAKNRAYQKAEQYFQEDADLVRLADLEYWTGVIEEYHKKTGKYPLQNQLQSKNEIVLVKVATQFQRKFLSPGSDEYMPDMDNNKGERFTEKSMKDFVTVLEQGVKHPVDERYDIQKVPTKSPIGYNYFATHDGYLFWVTCQTCGVTPISTLLMDGYTPTVNIASIGMIDKVTKARIRKDMLSDEIFKKWIARPFHKKKYIDTLIKETIHETKN